MRDMPFFTTEFGVASLTLAEIPYKQEAYIRLQSTKQPGELLQECIAFCRACGAERIYAAGDAALQAYPLYTEIWRMHCSKAALEETDACLFPVQKETLELWRQHYNDRMRDVPNAATMTVSAAEKMLQEGGGYFVHKNRQLWGIGKVNGGCIEAVISLEPGRGKDVVCALSHAVPEDMVTVDVASANHKAVGLYDRLGFLKTACLSAWYKVWE